MNDKDYDHAVRSIPHLNLTQYVPKVPIDDMLDEYLTEEKNIKSFEYGIDVNKNPDMIKIVEYLKKHWQGFGIVDITEKGDHMIDYLTEDVTHERIKSLGVELDQNGFGIYKPTDIGKRMIKTVEYIYTLFHYVGRVRLSILKPNGVIGYHNHEVKTLVDRKKLARPLIAEGVNRSTIHIPLIDNPKSRHLVTKGFSEDYIESDKFTLPDNAVQYSQTYKSGEVWLFNSVHYHKAENFGNADRVHILCYFDHMDRKIRPYIEQAIENYQGDWITR